MYPVHPVNPVESHSLTKRFGELTAVEDLNITIKSGELFGFIGPNGAGKTTTLQMFSGQIPPAAGKTECSG
ncbi:MAG: ATP-binding cassette domain-containing protein [Methanosarcinales archaeon]|nr:MAG: ATP-binding cassette domain-containing protein [Methanosarcinales archaeon]